MPAADDLVALGDKLVPVQQRDRSGSGGGLDGEQQRHVREYC
jgi:hypothetical protein